MRAHLESADGTLSTGRAVTEQSAGRRARRWPAARDQRSAGGADRRHPSAFCERAGDGGPGFGEVVARHPGVLAVTSTARNVGAARRLATDHALEHADGPRTMWLANTDADSRFPLTGSPK